MSLEDILSYIQRVHRDLFTMLVCAALSDAPDFPPQSFFFFFL